MLLTLLVFLIILSLLVLVHECGHFLTAKFFGVRVEEFGLNLPPRIIGWQKTANGWQKVGKDSTDNQTTIFSLNWLPLGGFVKIKGEQGEFKEQTDSFAAKPLWQRGIILAAGVTMNLLLTVVLLSIGFMIGLPQVTNDLPKVAIVSENQIEISEILENSPAAQAGLQAGDIIEKINGQQITTSQELNQYIANHPEEQLAIEVTRQNQKQTASLKPAIIKEIGRPALGVGIVESGLVRYPFFWAFWYGLKATFSLLWQLISAIFNILVNLISWQKVNVEVVGPVGIAVLTGKMIKLGWLYVLQFAALLSLTLSVMNFLPFPALDGGRFLFLVIEKIRGKAISQNIENSFHNIGYILLLLLILFITCRDLWRWQDKLYMLWHSLVNFF